jgi:hypothetical protein
MSATPTPKIRCRFAAIGGSQICYGILACISIKEACLLSLDAGRLRKHALRVVAKGEGGACFFCCIRTRSNTSILLDNARILTSVHHISATAFVDRKMGCSCKGASYESVFLFGVYFCWYGATVFLVLERCAC